MDRLRQSLMVGIGSPNGDDRIGWAIAEWLAQQDNSAFDVRIAQHPANLLDWLGGVDSLIVCDAFVAASAGAELARWRWPASEIQRIKFSGSHNLPLPAVLELAERLGQLPREVSIVGVRIQAGKPGEALSPALARRIPHFGETIARWFAQDACHA